MRRIRNATALIILLAMLTELTWHQAIAAQNGCGTSEAAQGHLATFDADLERARSEVKSAESARQAAIDQKAQALVSSGAWTEDDKEAFFSKILASENFLALENQKKLHLNKFLFSVMSAAGLRATRPTGACEFAMEALAELTNIAKLNDAQYDLMESTLPNDNI